MRDYAKTEVLGNVSWVDTLRYTQREQPVLNFRLIVNDSFENQAGERVERKTSHKIVVFGPTAEAHADQVKVGARYFVSGRPQTRAYEAQDGSTRYSYEIVANGPGCGMEKTRDPRPKSEPPKRERTQTATPEEAPPAASEDSEETVSPEEAPPAASEEKAPFETED